MSFVVISISDRKSALFMTLKKKNFTMLMFNVPLMLYQRSVTMTLSMVVIFKTCEVDFCIRKYRQKPKLNLQNTNAQLRVLIAIIILLNTIQKSKHTINYWDSA